ncbi:MAG TPA: hypothetical protein VKD22_08245 [Ramlibacter sp.]|nr:hypothetical protein [Ramlibacter sp.]
MTAWLIGATLAALALVPAGVHASDAMILGVQTHFAFTPPRTDAKAFRSWMARARFTSARDEMFWWHVEGPAARLEMRQGAVVTRDIWRTMPAGFDPLLTLDFGYGAYDGGGQPRSAAARAAFARYAGFVVSQAQPQVRMVEVWNEWNLKSGARPEGGSNGDAADYVRLASSTYEAIKSRDAGVKVIVGGIGDDLPDWPWTRRAIALGLLTRADGLSVHLYNYCMAPGRVGADELIERLDALRAIMAAAGHSAVPVYVTEVGWPTHTGKCAVSEADAAAYAVRFMLEASLRPWVRGIWFYELQDGGDDPANREHHFGLLRRDGSEKPAGCALRELGAQIAARPRMIARVGGVTMARFAHGAMDRWILWPTSGSVDGSTVAAVTARPDLLRALKPIPVCGLEQGSLAPQPDGRSAAVRLPPHAILVIDIPPAEALTLEALK